MFVLDFDLFLNLIHDNVLVLDEVDEFGVVVREKANRFGAMPFHEHEFLLEFITSFHELLDREQVLDFLLVELELLEFDGVQDQLLLVVHVELREVLLLRRHQILVHPHEEPHVVRENRAQFLRVLLLPSPLEFLASRKDQPDFLRQTSGFDVLPHCFDLIHHERHYVRVIRFDLR